MGAGSDYTVIGGGPAGVAAAYVLGRAGYRVTLYDMAPRLGFKPCGRGIPSTGDLPFDIPRDSIVRRIRGAALYVDSEPVFEIEEGLNGIIVDKGGMLEGMLADAGVELVKRAFYKVGSREVRVGGSYRRVERGFFAGGHPYYTGETINAIQYRVKGEQFEYMDKLVIYFDTRLIGYYYVFPNRGDEADVGVGGFADFETLRLKLDKFMENNDYTRGAKILRLEGARIAVGGVVLGNVDGLEVIGEAAGYVLPLTGEGIRPSMLSGAYAADAVLNGKDVRGVLREAPITKAIRLQRRILDRVKKMTPERRASLLKSMPPSVHAMIALGRVDKKALLKALAGKPSLLAKILNLL